MTLGAYLNDPTLIFQVWKGGNVFHGGLLGVLLAVWCLAAAQNGKRFFEVMILRAHGAYSSGCRR